MCRYCEPDEAGNLTPIEEDRNHLLTCLADYGTKWVLFTELSTMCCGTDCWTKTETVVNNCPMCGRKLTMKASD